MVEKNREVVSVNLELPLEVAEFIVSRGDELVRAVETALKDYRRNPSHQNAEHAHRKREERREARLRELSRIGRTAHRMLRHRMAHAMEEKARAGRSFTPTEKQDVRRDIIKRIAAELKEGHELVSLAIRRFRKAIKERRAREILRCARNWMTEPEIAERYGISKKTVGRILTRERERLGLSRTYRPVPERYLSREEDQ